MYVRKPSYRVGVWGRENAKIFSDWKLADCSKINDFWDPRNNEFLCVFTGKLMILGCDFGGRFWRGFWRGFWTYFLMIF